MFGIQQIDSSQLLTLMEDEPESFLLVDVRGMSEMGYGMLPGAVAIPMHLVPVRPEQLKKERKVVFYCQTGARSGQVCAFLQQQGIGQVFNLRAGIVGWQRRGHGIQPTRRRSLAGQIPAPRTGLLNA